MTDLILMTTSAESSEVVAIQAFLEWQNINCELVESFEVLKFTNGHPSPIIIKNDMVMAKGFFNIIEYFKTRGMIQC